MMSLKRSFAAVVLLVLGVVGAMSLGSGPAPAGAAPGTMMTAGETPLPSVYVAFGEQAWTRPEFDYTLHGGGAKLLDLPVDSYDRVLLFPFGYAEAGNRNYEFERALRFTENVQGIGKLLSLQRLLDGLHARGKARSQICVYLPGFFASNAAEWDRALRPPTPRRDGVQPPETFEERLWRLLMYLRTPQGEPRCTLAWDASGDLQPIGSLAALAIGHASRWNFDSLTEGHPYPGSALQGLPSITTAWHALESPSSYLYPTSMRSILCNNSSGIGRAAGAYQPGQPIGRFGMDHRRNYVPQWRREGRTVYLEVFGFGADGSPPACWEDGSGGV